MSIKQFFVVFCSFCVVGAVTFPAHALENLIYNQSLSKSSALLLKKYLNTPPNTSNIAQIDLNDDGLSEFIVKPEQCTLETTSCEFMILAETDREIISLGTIKARNINVSTKTTSGVRNIHAFDNPLNDFDYSLYHWEAARSRYMMEE